MQKIDVVTHNQIAWDNQSKQAISPWVQPVSSEEIAAAKKGEWQVILTPTKSVPRDWFGDMSNKTLLGLASGGGQQVPIFAYMSYILGYFGTSPFSTVLLTNFLVFPDRISSF